MSIADKLSYLNDTKEGLRIAINQLGGRLTKTTPFRNYADGLNYLYSKIPKVEAEGENITFNDVASALMKLDLKGNTSQSGTPTPTSPIPVSVVSGDNEVVVCGKNLLPNEWVSGSISGSTGLPVGYDSRIYTTNKIQLEGNTTYYLKHNNTSTWNLRIAVDEYDKNSTYLGRIGGINGSVNGSFTTQNNTSFINLTIIESTDTITYAQYQELLQNGKLQPMLNKGSSEIPYEPYQSQTYEVDLPVENLLDTNKMITFQGPVASRWWWIDGKVASSYTTEVYYQVQAGQSYTFSIHSKANVDRVQGIYNINGTESQAFIIEGSNTSATFTPNTTTNLYVRLHIIDANTDTYCKGLLEKGTKANHYTEYGTTPIELCKIGDYQDYFTKNSGKNLFDKDNANTIDCLVNGMNGTITSFNGCKTLYIPIESSKSYTISKRVSARFTVGTCSSTPTNSVVCGTFIQNNSATNITITSGANDKYLCVFYYLSGTDTLTEQQILDSIMINEGSTALPYEPYGTGQWCKYNAIGKVVYDENTSFSEYNTTTHSFVKYNPFEIIDKSSYSTGTKLPEIVSNYYTSVKWNDFLNGTTGLTLYYANNTLQIRLSSDLTTISDYQNWLSTHNVELLYPLSTPYLSLIEDTTLISQLDNIQNAMSYEGQTNISQVNDDKPFIISAKALTEIVFEGGE